MGSAVEAFAHTSHSLSLNSSMRWFHLLLLFGLTCSVALAGLDKLWKNMGKDIDWKLADKFNKKIGKEIGKLGKKLGKFGKNTNNLTAQQIISRFARKDMKSSVQLSMNASAVQNTRKIAIQSTRRSAKTSIRKTVLQ